MDKPISPGLKVTFLVHAVVGVISGLAFLLIPQAVANLFNFNLSGGEPYLRFVGAAILGYAASSWLGYLAREWREVKIIVQAEIPWTFLGAALSAWFIVDRILPSVAWVNFVIMALFFVAFVFFYWREETVPTLKAA
jgi:MFS superfamily sulfate permease-like transporter